MASSLLPARILVIDDDPVLADLLTSLLGAVGYTVTSSAGGEEALALLRNGYACDIILTDLRLPGLSGCALAAELAQLRPSDALLLGMSGSEPGRAELDLLDAFLTKPFGLREFSAALHRAQLRHQLRPSVPANSGQRSFHGRYPPHASGL